MKVVFLTLFLLAINEGELSIGLQAAPNAAQELCTDEQLLNGSEPLVSYGLDSTKNWWAITMPYDSLYRLWVNGKKTIAFQSIQNLSFSADGEHWAAWGQFQNQWNLVVDGNSQIVSCTQPGEIRFSQSTAALYYTYFDGSQEVIVGPRQKFTVVGRVGPLIISAMGDRVAYVIGQIGTKSIVMNSKQGPLYEDLKVLGFWTDGQLLYAALSGAQWRLYRGDEELAGPYPEINDIKINQAGTVAAAIVTQGANRQVVLIAEEYTRPLLSRQYQELDALVLHPTLALWAARSQQTGAGLVIMTNTEYSAGSVGTGLPFFTADGKELVYFGCDSECFVSINGKKTPINQTISIDATYARKSGASTFAYSSMTSLIFREVERQDLWVSKMCDETSTPRYNWRRDRYEALGKINQRLYLLSCMK